MIRVYYTHAAVENISPALLENWIKTGMQQLPAAKREQILRLRPPLSRFNSTFGWLLVSYGFKHSGYTEFELSRLKFEDRKKPRWPDGSYDFNLTHSGSLLACVLSDNSQVGIDVELIHPLHDRKGMFERILAPEENPPADAGPEVFFQYWTRKEAVIKAEGSGGVWDMHEVRLQGMEAYYKDRNWKLCPLELVNGYAACVASAHSNSDIQIEAVTCEQLIAVN